MLVLSLTEFIINDRDICSLIISLHLDHSIAQGWVFPLLLSLLPPMGAQSCLWVFKLLKILISWTGGMAQAVEHLLCKCKVLSSNPSPTKKINKKT
jgi:hypothetical protein